MPIQPGFKILHLAHDVVFINTADFLYEKAFPEQNKFLIIQKKEAPLSNVKIKKNFNVLVINRIGLKKILREINNSDIVIMHGLTKVNATIFLRSNSRNKFVLHTFGAEIYNKKVLGKSFLGPVTQKLINKIEVVTQKRTRTDTKKDTGLNIVTTIKKVFSITRKWIRALSERNRVKFEPIDAKSVSYEISNHCKSIYEEFVYFKSLGVIKESANFIPFSYYPLEYLIADENLRINGNDILLGNSASFTNNHLEAIEILSGIELGDRQINIPLSYGKDDYYINEVISYANELIPDNIKILKDFLPIDQYIKLISRCSIVIMNHYRQQALGNILISLYLGAKVFINNTVVYNYLKRIGCCVYLIEKDLKKTGFAAIEPIGINDVENNRNILKKEVSTNKIVNNLRQGITEYFTN